MAPPKEVPKEEAKEGNAVTVRPNRPAWMALASAHPQLYRRMMGGKGNATVSRWPGMIPDRMEVKLRYSEVFNLAPASPWVFENYCTSLYDPYVSGVGGQPAGFDQWMAFYQNFTVRGVRYKVRWMSSEPTWFAVFPARTNVTLMTYAGVASQPLVQLGGTYGSGGGGPVGTLDTGHVSVNEFFGLTVEQFRATEDFWGTAAASPAVSLFMCGLFWSADGTTHPTGRFVVELEFDAEFFNRKQLDMS